MPTAAPNVERRDDKTVVVATRCRDCGISITLRCGDTDPPPSALSIAGMIVCDPCHAKYELAAEHDAEIRLAAERTAASGLPRDLQAARFADAHRTGTRGPVVDATENWALADDPRGLLLWGPVGRGKTWLAAAAANSRLRLTPLRWVSVAHLLTQIQAAFTDPARVEAVKTLTGSGGLVLDDLDKVAPSEWAKAQLFTAIDRRINNGSKLLVTTNLKPSELGQRFGESIMSRLAGYCRVYHLDGHDHRLAGPAPDGDATIGE